MRVVALHQGNMMTIERYLKSEQLVDLIEYIDMMGYGEGVYETGPAMVSLPTDQFFADETQQLIQLELNKQNEDAQYGK